MNVFIVSVRVRKKEKYEKFETALKNFFVYVLISNDNIISA